MKINRKTIKANLRSLRTQKRVIRRFKGNGVCITFYKSNGSKKRNIRKKIYEYIRHYKRYDAIFAEKRKEQVL